MPRINPLKNVGAKTPIVPLPAKTPAKKPRKKAVPSAIPAGTSAISTPVTKGRLNEIAKILAAVSDATILFMSAQAATRSLLASRGGVLPSDKPDAGKIKGELLAWWSQHPEITDWRDAWAESRKSPPAKVTLPPPDPTPKPVVAPPPAATPQSPSVLYPAAMRTKSMPDRLCQVMARRGDITAFEAAIRGRGEFSRKYELDGYMPLSIEVLPPAMSPVGVPSVALSHTFIQNGDIMRDPEIVFAVLTDGEWMPYECTQHPVGVYSSAFADGTGKAHYGVVRDILALANVWARNLHAQGWTKFIPPTPRKTDGPTLGDALAPQLEAAIRVIIPFPRPGTIEHMEQIRMPS